MFIVEQNHGYKSSRKWVTLHRKLTRWVMYQIEAWYLSFSKIKLAGTKSAGNFVPIHLYHNDPLIFENVIILNFCPNISIKRTIGMSYSPLFIRTHIILWYYSKYSIVEYIMTFRQYHNYEKFLKITFNIHVFVHCIINNYTIQIGQTNH